MTPIWLFQKPAYIIDILKDVCALEVPVLIFSMRKWRLKGCRPFLKPPPSLSCLCSPTLNYFKETCRESSFLSQATQESDERYESFSKRNDTSHDFACSFRRLMDNLKFMDS